MSKKVINHFKNTDPILYKALLLVHKKHGDKIFILEKPLNLFETLCESIVSQQLSVKAGDTIFGRVLDLLPGRLLTPENILKTKDEDLRKAGLSNNKVKYFKDLAEKIKNKEVILEDLDKLPPKRKQLQNLRKLKA
jgi:3-methyladenine DNA glycosylase/8-oxoguanine DNA glycosylase